MRRAALVLLVVLAPSIAAAQAPPSPTLERAIKLYDRQDWFSSSIELKKVLDAETGDTPDNVERAKFFMAKDLFQMQFHVASYAYFQQIIDGNGAYRTASFKWIAGLRPVVPDTYLAPSIASMTLAELDDPVLANVRAELLEIQKAKKRTHANLHEITRDALGCTHPDARRMTEIIEKMRSFDDNAELTAATRLALRQNDVFAQTIDLAMQRAPAVRDGRKWLGELRDELERLSKSDRAWQTTQIAAEILQEVTIQQSVGEADFGKQLRELYDAMLPEIAQLGAYNTPVDRCTRELGAALAGTPPPNTAPATTPMVVGPRANGCCSTGGGSPDGGGLLVVLLAVAFRRKSRAASGTRSLRA